MARELIYDQGARTLLADGICALANLAKPAFGTPAPLEDKLTLKNQYEQMGLELARNLLSKMPYDGSKRALLLLEALVEYGLKRINDGEDCIAVKESIHDEVSTIISRLKKMSIKNCGARRDELEKLMEEALLRNAAISFEASSQSGLAMRSGVAFKSLPLSTHLSGPFELDFPQVIVQERVDSIHEILPMLSKSLPTLIVARTFHPDVIASIVANSIDSRYNICAVAAPSNDIFEKVSNLGNCEKVSIHGEQVQLIGSHGDPIGVIRTTCTREEFERKLYRLLAIKKEGAICGGGAALFHAGNKTLLKEVCEVPVRQLLRNCNQEAPFIIRQMTESGETYGYNKLSSKVEDLVEAGVLDPTEVVIQALTRAAQMACEVLISEVLIGEYE